MSNQESEENNPVIKKRRGRPKGYRKAEDGTWYKIDDNGEKIVTESIKPSKKPKIISINDSEECESRDTISNSINDDIEFKQSEFDFEDSEEPSDSELLELENQNEFLDDEDINSSLSEYEQFFNTSVIRPITFDYEATVKKDGFMSKLRPYIHFDTVKYELFNKFDKFNFYFSTLEDYFRNELKVSSNGLDEIVDNFILKDRLEHSSSSFNQNSRPLYLIQNINNGPVAILIPAEKFREPKLSLKIIAPSQFNTITDLVLKSNSSYYILYPKTDNLNSYVSDFEFIKSDNLENSDTNIFGLIIKITTSSFNNANTNSLYNSITFNSSPLQNLFYTFTSFWSLNDTNDESSNAVNYNTNSNNDDYDDDYNDTDYSDDTNNDDDDRYLVDPGEDNPYLDFCDRLIDKTNEELRGNRPLTYDQIFYPGTNRDRREFDSLDNGNYRHKATGLSDEYNMDDLD